jgi:hypothetical protein
LDWNQLEHAWEQETAASNDVTVNLFYGAANPADESSLMEQDHDVPVM